MSKENIKNTNNNNSKNPRGMLKFRKPKDMKNTVKRLFQYITEYKNLFIWLVITIFIYTAANILLSISIKDLVKALGTYDVDQKLWTLDPDRNLFIRSLIICISMIVLYLGTRYAGDLISAVFSTKITRKLRKDTFYRLVKLPIKYTDTHQHGDLMSRVVNDVDNVSNAISSTASHLIGGILTIISFFCLMIWYSPLLTVAAIIILILTLGNTILISKFMTPLYRKQQKLLGQLNSDAEEMISGSKTVIAYNHQEVAKEKFATKSNEMSKLGIKAQIIGGSMGPMMNFIGNVGYFLVCIFGAIFINKGIGNQLNGDPLTPAIVILFLTAIRQFNRPINEIAQLYSQLVSAVTAADRIFEILDEKEEDFSGKVEFNSKESHGIIDFNHIGFGYVPEKQVLTDFNVDIRSGHKIALVGATGSGKTTIVNLLLRFYDITSGKITIDGIDIMDISKKDLRDSISIVLQDPVLFQDSVENNIKYGRAGATDEEVDEALEFANCKSFVNKLPEGKKTILSEGATNISQGQRQLLTIARAVIADPKILILDEATSSVDTRTEKKIQNAMQKLMQNRTSIIIAHRLSTIQDADLIIVLANGKIAEMGSHQELIELDGVYNKLYQSQFAGYQI